MTESKKVPVPAPIVKEGSKAREASDARFRILFDQAPTGILLIRSDDAQIIDFNTRAHADLGYSREEFSRLSIADIDADMTPEDIETIYKKVVQDGTAQFETRHWTKTGEIRHVLVNSARVSLEGETILKSTWTDISERKQLEQELQQNARLLSSVYESLDEAVLVIDPETRCIISVNTGTEKMFGYTQADMVGHNTQFLHIDDESYQKFGKMLFPALDKNGIFHTEFPVKRKSGEIFASDLTVKEVLNSEGNRELVVTAIRDISKQKKIMDQLKAKEMTLTEQASHLKELNITLKVLLDRRDNEQSRQAEDLSHSITTILTYLENIRKNGLSDIQEEFLNILKLNLEELIKPHMHTISGKLTSLTKSETQVAHYVRKGRTSKEIASMLNLSVRTVEFHRDSIRHKLGLKNQKVNLRTFLTALK